MPFAFDDSNILFADDASFFDDGPDGDHEWNRTDQPTVRAAKARVCSTNADPSPFKEEEKKIWHQHEEYGLFKTSLDNEDEDEWLETIWDYLEDTHEIDRTPQGTCHRAHTTKPYQDNRKWNNNIRIDDYSHPFYTYVMTNTHTDGDNDMSDGIIDSKSNQLYSVIEETECQIREEVKTVNDRMRRRKKGAYTAYV